MTAKYPDIRHLDPAELAFEVEALKVDLLEARHRLTDAESYLLQSNAKIATLVSLLKRERSVYERCRRSLESTAKDLDLGW